MKIRINIITNTRISNCETVKSPAHDMNYDCLKCFFQYKSDIIYKR